MTKEKRRLCSLYYEAKRVIEAGRREGRPRAEIDRAFAPLYRQLVELAPERAEVLRRFWVVCR